MLCMLKKIEEEALICLVAVSSVEVPASSVEVAMTVSAASVAPMYHNGTVVALSEGFEDFVSSNGVSVQAQCQCNQMEA